ncbi:MAG: PfkB family carbohydrate kinase [Halobacteriales archaeon]|nr:PfkB family carbohydrate kinase [Halobacteriales archaeon]
MPRVLCAGHVNWDVTLQVDALPEPDGEARIEAQRRSGGGSAANAAVTLAGLGVPTGLVGSVGDDDHGTLLRAALGDRGVALDGLRTVHGAETTVKYLIVDRAGEVMVLGNEGANEAVAPEDLSADLLAGVEHVHLTSQRPDTAAALAGLAHEAGAGVSFDPGRRLADRDFGEALRLADIVFLNDREAAAVAELDPAAIEGSVVVEKRGRAGAEVRWADGSATHGGFDVEPVDSTGAGDAFAAGFIAARLDGADHTRALAYGNACGALATAGEGAWVAPGRDEVEAVVGDA